MRKRPLEDTIAAIATPPGEGGIGIVRLSGPDAAAITAAVFVSSRGHDVLRQRARTWRTYHGSIVEPGAGDAGASVDEVLVHVMRAPHTYTCEDVVEISGHGGAAPLKAILELVLRHGARLAQPGEFTKRAFLNGRIDLVQAEAVVDRIQARTRAALRAASASAEGRLSREIAAMKGTLVEALARVEAAVDFPEDDLPDLVDEALLERIEETRNRMRELLATSEAGRLCREGASAAIVGRPNVGKSSLFNALVRDARAIVTSKPGTTRDLIEETITIEGVPVRLSDTAGLRSTDDEVEQIGVQRARGALQAADLVVFVADAGEADHEEERVLAEGLCDGSARAVFVLNKTDVAPEGAFPVWAEWFGQRVRMSARTGEGLKELEHALGTLLLGEEGLHPDEAMLTRVHQQDSLRRAEAAVSQLLTNRGASPEFLSLDLREALGALGEITGETTPEDVLDRIFSTFCIGK